MKAHLNREKDRELYKLAQYLKEIAKLEDFSGLNHKHWERYAHTLNTDTDDWRVEENDENKSANM